jgi:hypothetical protein
LLPAPRDRSIGLGVKTFILGVALALCGMAHAGHEFPFYPSFYPQEITVEALDPASAAARLAKGTLHAYAGAISAPGAKLGTVTSLGGYVVARVPELSDRAARCAAARGMKEALPPGAIWHPYPVTPFHADYLYHADRAEAARAAPPAAKMKGAQVEVVDLAALLQAGMPRYDAWPAPARSRQGWFHAYLLLANAVRDQPTRARVETTARRLMRGDYRSLEERVALERDLVELLQADCERVVLGYTLRRETYGADYSQGVENVGYDALAGIASPIFARTVKLRDFPWNGWLDVAAPRPPASPWNPFAGGFGDAFGRLVWSALADPAFLPSPHGAAWIENRVSATVDKSEKPFAVPKDALFATEGGSARLRITYRVRNSAFHDGTPMSVADLLYAYAMAANPAFAKATAPARERLKGVRVLKVDTETLAFGEDKLRYDVPVVEVYLDAAPDTDAVAVAPPWTTLPWHAAALFEEGARRGYFQLASFDPVRDSALVHRLEGLAQELEERGYVPRALAPYVSAQEARERYKRLRAFYAEHGHWLVTNGPYLLNRWDGAKAVLSVFRDPSYPKGLGSFNRYAVPLKAYVTGIERRGDGVDIRTETEWLQRLGRDVRVMRGSFAQRLAEELTGPLAPPVPLCHYMLLGRQGPVLKAGAVPASNSGACRINLKRGAGERLVLAPVLEDNFENAAIKIVPWE